MIATKEKPKTLRIAVNGEQLLERLIRRYKNNENISVSQQLPPLKLYKECEGKLAVFKNEKLLRRFYKAILKNYGIN